MTACRSDDRFEWITPHRVTVSLDTTDVPDPYDLAAYFAGCKVTDSTQPHIPVPMIVPVDHYQVVSEDRMLCARLAGSFAICISDEVFEAGALLHMQAGRPGGVSDAELTDNTLSMDLLLLDRCTAELRAIAPQARHWQAQFIAHADPNAGGEERLHALRAFFEAALEDAGVLLANGTIHEDGAQWLSFRPALRQLRCETEAG